ncbi:YDG/SRA domain-containing protein [Streptomyces sp. CA-251247]|uniref:YDG/SRA domain-containing protein n=1 Tax=Streptomyces sp. CA-251247 TaxID=3240062 RepID=UPI003D8BC78B
MTSERKQVKFGTPDGISEGDWFKGHAELYAKYLHRRPGRGISGTFATGADSIILSGGYIDDEDNGSEIIYTGEGGRDPDTGRMIADQSLTDDGNAALVISQGLGYPVRVIEGLDVRGKTRRRAMGGYRYRGLYRVTDHWLTYGREHFLICRFHLLKVASGSDVQPCPVDPLATGETTLERATRRYVAQNRLVRDSKVARKVKHLHNNTCQICSLRLVVSPTGEAHSEAAHIQAVGKPHHGADLISNVLCLCPNCHALFDRGALHITDTFDVIDNVTGRFVAELRQAQGHNIGVEFIQRHRDRWQVRHPE